jgi:hypothetical protein
MFRHVVLLTFNDDTTDEQLAAFKAALEALPAQIPQILDYQVGHDAGLADTNHQFAIVADFADAADYVVYRDHPAHAAFKEEFLSPLVTERAAVQYEW